KQNESLWLRAFTLRPAAKLKFAQNVCPDVLSPNGNKPSGLFPLYRCWRLTGDVVRNAGHVFNLVDDTVRHFFQQFVRQVRPARGRYVEGFHGAPADYTFVTPRTAPRTHRRLRN